MEKQKRGSGVTVAMCHSNYADSVPTAVIAKVLEKPEPGGGSSCPATRSPSPQLRDDDEDIDDGDFLTGTTGSSDHLSNRRVSYKTSDLYCSDTALYCPERWQQDGERRQSADLHGAALLQLHVQNSTDSNPDEEAFHSGSFSHDETLPPPPPASAFHQRDDFGAASLRASSSYSSFSLASDDKGGVMGGGGSGRTPSSTLSSSHQGLYMDWRDLGNGEYGGRKSTSAYDRDPTFPKSLSIQHMVTSSSSARSPQKVIPPAYARTASCFSEPYHSSAPRLASSRSMGSSSGLSPAHGVTAHDDALEDELSGRWRQLSVEDVAAFSTSGSYGRVSPYSFSERHFAAGPPGGKVKGSLYGSFQEGDEVFHSRRYDVGSPGRSPKASEHQKQDKVPALYRAKEDSQDSEGSLFLSGSSKEKDGVGAGAMGPAGGGSAKRDYVNLSADSSAESLHQSSLEASSLQHYPNPRPNVRPRPSSSSALSVGPALPKKTSPRYQKFGSTGLTRKDSLTKAQLYGTLLN